MAGMSNRHRSLTRFGLAVRREREAKGLTQERERENLAVARPGSKRPLAG